MAFLAGLEQSPHGVVEGRHLSVVLLKGPTEVVLFSSAAHRRGHDLASGSFDLLEEPDAVAVALGCQLDQVIQVFLIPITELRRVVHHLLGKAES